MYKNALASEYNILLLICSFTLKEESKCHVACDLLETTFATTTDHGDTREENQVEQQLVWLFGQTQLNT